MLKAQDLALLQDANWLYLQTRTSDHRAYLAFCHVFGPLKTLSLLPSSVLAFSAITSLDFGRAKLLIFADA